MSDMTADSTYVYLAQSTEEIKHVNKSFVSSSNMVIELALLDLFLCGL